MFKRELNIILINSTEFTMELKLKNKTGLIEYTQLLQVTPTKTNDFPNVDNNQVDLEVFK